VRNQLHLLQSQQSELVAAVEKILEDVVKLQYDIGVIIVAIYGCLLSQPRATNRSIIQGCGFGPTLYILHKSNLQPLSSINVLLKYADDTSLLVPEITDLSISQEFENIKKWAIDNKMLINSRKTKDIVFRRPNPYQVLQVNPVDDIEQVREAKVVGVILNHKFHFDSHVQFILRQCRIVCISLN
jgi:Reverse transcriptase (RNA-dependent DNA polymerase)